jgi:hypothetical protein
MEFWTLTAEIGLMVSFPKLSRMLIRIKLQVRLRDAGLFLMEMLMLSGLKT